MKTIGFFIFLVTGCITLKAQQLPVFSQFQHNYGFLNPAMMHHDYILEGYQTSIGGTYRHQWSELQHAPRTGTIRGEHIFELDKFSIYNKKPVSIGSAMYFDKTGPISLIGGNFKSSFGLSLNKRTHLYTGFSFSLNQFSFEGDIALLQDPNDPVGTASERNLVPGFNVGIVLNSILPNKNEDNIFIGYSPNYIAPELQPSNPEGYTPVIHHYFLVGIINYFSDRSRNINRQGYRNIESMLWLKYVKNVPVEGNFNFNLTLNVGGTSALEFGSGISFDLNGRTNLFNTLYLEPGVVFGDGTSNFIARISFIFYLHMDELRPNFGQIWEPNFNISME